MSTTTIVPYVPPATSSTSTSSSTSTTTACTATIVANAMTLTSYKNVALGIPGFTSQVTTANSNTVRVLGYRVQTVPDPTTGGLLKLNDVIVTAGQAIQLSDLGKLVFTAANGASSTGSFTFRAETTCGNSADATITFNISDAPYNPCTNCGSTTSSTTTTTV